MLVVEPIGERNEFIVPAALAGLVAADEQKRRSPGIERIQHSERSSAMLDAQLAEVPMPRTDDPRAMRKRQGRPEPFDQTDRRRNRFLLGSGETVPPRTELVRVLDGLEHNLSGI